MYSDNDFRLYHHGIKGQKWGNRNGPPYPLSSEAHSSSEKEAGWKSSLTKARVNKGISTKSKGIDLQQTRFAGGGNWLKPTEDKQIIPVERRVRADGTYSYPAIGRVIGDFEKYAPDRNPYPGPKGFDGLFDRVNPNYGEYGTTNNCTFVAATMQIASMGYGVIARHANHGASAEALSRWFSGAKNEYCDSWDEMKQDILNDGDGASGVLQGYYGTGLGGGKGGHALHWRNENGKIIVADGQCHEEMDFDDVVGRYGFGEKGCIRTRLDNCKPDWDEIARDGVLDLPDTGQYTRGYVNRGDDYLPYTQNGTFYDRTGSQNRW